MNADDFKKLVSERKREYKEVNEECDRKLVLFTKQACTELALLVEKEMGNFAVRCAIEDDVKQHLVKRIPIKLTCYSESDYFQVERQVKTKKLEKYLKEAFPGFTFFIMRYDSGQISLLKFALDEFSDYLFE